MVDRQRRAELPQRLLRPSAQPVDRPQAGQGRRLLALVAGSLGEVERQPVLFHRLAGGAAGDQDHSQTVQNGGDELVMVDLGEAQGLPVEALRLLVAAEAESVDAETEGDLGEAGGILRLGERRQGCLEVVARLRLGMEEEQSEPDRRLRLCRAAGVAGVLGHLQRLSIPAKGGGLVVRAVGPVFEDAELIERLETAGGVLELVPKVERAMGRDERLGVSRFMLEPLGRGKGALGGDPLPVARTRRARIGQGDAVRRAARGPCLGLREDDPIPRRGGGEQGELAVRGRRPHGHLAAGSEQAHGQVLTLPGLERHSRIDARRQVERDLVPPSGRKAPLEGAAGRQHRGRGGSGGGRHGRSQGLPRRLRGAPRQDHHQQEGAPRQKFSRRPDSGEGRGAAGLDRQDRHDGWLSCEFVLHLTLSRG